MKKAIFGIVVLAIVGSATWYYVSLQPSEELCAQVVTDARNPATGEIRTFPTPCDVPEGWDVLETDQERFEKNGETYSRYRNDDLGIRFEYRVEPDGYTLVEQKENQVSHDALVEFVSLFNTREYMELLVSSVAREGPPAISVLIFDNPNKYSPLEWAAEERAISNFGLVLGETSEIEFAGSPAIRYLADGLYVSDTIIVANNGRIYLISGSYATEDSPIRKDFLEMLKYVSLY